MELPIAFHFPKNALTLDIQRPILNIHLQEADSPIVCYLWYKDNDPSKEICIYLYNTIVFDNTRSPMILGAVLLEQFQQYDDPVAVNSSHKLYIEICFPVSKLWLRLSHISIKHVRLCMKVISFFVNGRQIDQFYKTS